MEIELPSGMKMHLIKDKMSAGEWRECLSYAYQEAQKLGIRDPNYRKNPYLDKKVEKLTGWTRERLDTLTEDDYIELKKKIDKIDNVSAKGSQEKGDTIKK